MSVQHARAARSSRFPKNGRMRSLGEAVDFAVMSEEVFVQAAVLRVIQHIANRARVKARTAFRDVAGLVQRGCDSSKRRSSRTHCRDLPNKVASDIVDQYNLLVGLACTLAG